MNKNNAIVNVLRYRKSECDHRIYGIVIRVLMNYGQHISKFVRYDPSCWDRWIFSTQYI
jgi:hypothetical protein